MEELIKSRLALLHEVAPDSLGDLLRLELEALEGEDVILRAKTQGWMRNTSGTLHGGMGATLADQAMGTIAYCKKPGEGTVSTIELGISYHRPLFPGEDVLIRVRTLSATRTLMRLECHCYQASRPHRLCLSANATFYYVPAK